MTSLLYHTSQPEAIQSSGYIEYNNVDFVLNVGAGRSLSRNSVRVNGDIEIQSVAGTRVTSENVFLDFRIGVHGCIDSCQVSFGNSGIKENIANYGRWCEMSAIGSIYEDDYLNASHQVELRAPNEECSRVNSQGIGSGSAQSSIVITDGDFSIKPLCILNRMQGDPIPFEKSGEIRLTLNLARNVAALMGTDQVVGSAYILKNLHCSYTSVPTEGKWSDSQTMMRSVYNVKSTILSGAANISAQVPAVCDAVSCSFQLQSNENQVVKNTYSCETVQNIDRVAFLFNDATNQYVTYEINDQNEMLHRYIDSFAGAGHQQMFLDTFRANAGFGIGLDFNGMINLANQRFAVQLDSSIAAPDTSTNIFLYFHSMVEA